MLLTEVPHYINCLKIYNLTKKEINFSYIFTNSKNIKKYSVFVLKKSDQFNQSYIRESIKNGAVAIISNKYLKGFKITQFVVKNVDASLSILLNIWHPFF